MQEKITLWEHYLRLMPALILAITGGLVKVIQSPEEFSIPRLIVGVLTAGFTGTIIYLCLNDFDTLSETTKAAAIGVSGYAAGDILPALQKVLKRWLNNNALTRP